MSVGYTDELSIVALDWFSEDDIVEVTPRDQKRFEIQKERAIEILQLARQADKFQQQFELLLANLAQWILERRDMIKDAYVTLHDSSLAFVVVRDEVSYNEDFEDSLAELEYSIANDPDLEILSVTTFATPKVSLSALGSFLDQRMILQYHYGQRS